MTDWPLGIFAGCTPFAAILLVWLGLRYQRRSDEATERAERRVRQLQSGDDAVQPGSIELGDLRAPPPGMWHE